MATATDGKVVKLEDRVKYTRDLLERMKPQLALALPKHMSADRMARIALTSMIRTPRLLECDPATTAGAILTASQMGLEVDGREAHLVPFNNRKRGVLECQLIPDYKGLNKLARQSGEVKTLDFREVRIGDTFAYQYGGGGFLRHVPADEPVHEKNEANEWVEKRPVTHCYAVAVLASGEQVFEVMRIEDIRYHRDRYSKAAGDGPWITHEAEMGAKTCCRKLAKKLPYSPYLARAVELDELGEEGIAQELGTVFTAEGGGQTPAGDGAAAATGNGVTAPPGAGVEPSGASSKLTDLGAKLGQQAETGKGPGSPVATTGAPPDTSTGPPAADPPSSAPMSPGTGSETTGEPKAPPAPPIPGGPADDVFPAEARQALLAEVDVLQKSIGPKGLKATQIAYLWDQYCKGFGPDTVPKEKLEKLRDVLATLKTSTPGSRK